MQRMNLVVGVDREPVDGEVVRLRVGIADIDSSSWLSKPAVMDASQVIRRLEAGELFRTFGIDGIGDCLSLKTDERGYVRIVAVDEFAAESQLDDLPPC